MSIPEKQDSEISTDRPRDSINTIEINVRFLKAHLSELSQTAIIIYHIIKQHEHIQMVEIERLYGYPYITIRSSVRMLKESGLIDEASEGGLKIIAGRSKITTIKKTKDFEKEIYDIAMIMLEDAKIDVRLSFTKRVRSCIQNLIRNDLKDINKIKKYFEWWILKKSKRLEFTFGLVCCDSMCVEYHKAMKASKTKTAQTTAKYSSANKYRKKLKIKKQQRGKK